MEDDQQIKEKQFKHRLEKEITEAKDLKKSLNIKFRSSKYIWPNFGFIRITKIVSIITLT